MCFYFQTGCFRPLLNGHTDERLLVGNLSREKKRESKLISESLTSQCIQTHTRVTRVGGHRAAARQQDPRRLHTSAASAASTICARAAAFRTEVQVPLTRRRFLRPPSALLRYRRHLAMALANHRMLRHRRRPRQARACLPSTAARLRQVISVVVATAAAGMVPTAAAAVVVAAATTRLIRRHWAIRAHSTAAQTDTDHGA